MAENKNKCKKAGKNKGAWARWVTRGGLKRKARRIIASNGPAFAKAWSAKHTMQGTVTNLIAKREEQLAKRHAA